MIEQIRIIIEQCNRKGKKMEENRTNINWDNPTYGKPLANLYK